MNAPILDVYSTPLAGHTLIEASAGTGKTWTISGLYTRLLLDAELNLQVPDILVVTFTLAATAELRDRIRKRLSDVLDSFRAGQGSDEFCQLVGWVERSDTQHGVIRVAEEGACALAIEPNRWVSLRSTHLTNRVAG